MNIIEQIKEDAINLICEGSDCIEEGEWNADKALEYVEKFMEKVSDLLKN